MIGTQFTLTNKAGQSIKFNDHTTDPDNFIALQAYPAFEVEVRNDEINKEGQHGIWDFNSFYGKRLVTFEGVIVGTDENEVHTLRDALVNVTGLPVQPTSSDDGTLTITWTDPTGRALQLDAKLLAPLRFNRPLRHRYRLDFILQMKAADPVIESQTLTQNAGTRGYTTGSMQLKTKMPFKLSLVNRQTLTVSNSGTIEANTTIRMYGSPNHAITNPRITNVTTGKYMEVAVTLNGIAEYIEINSKTGTITDHNGIDRSGLITTGSTFVLLEVGSNILLFTSDENVDSNNPSITHVAPVAVLQVDHRDSIL